METFHDVMMEYKRQMQLGVIPKAYLGLMDYMSKLKNYLKSEHPDYSVSGSMYFGYMDMTYFSFFPESLGSRNLKAGIVFIHETCHFEVWLFGVNKKIQQEYWDLLKEKGFDNYPLVETTKGHDAIIEHVIVQKPDFNDLDELSKQIELETIRFIEDIERFLID
jgi:hypothetical protein